MRRNFDHIDPFTYKRKDKTVYNPIVNLKLANLARKSKMPYRDLKQAYVENKYGIPSENTLNLLRLTKEAQMTPSIREAMLGTAPKLPELQFSPLGVKYV